MSSLGLGTLTWGRDTPVEEARQIWASFIEAGGNVIDTSPTFGEGQAQAVIGSLLTSDFSREETILVSKGGFVSTGGRLRGANHRNAILGSLDATLQQLGTSYLDVLLLSRPDPHTPLEETLAAVNIAVSSGRVRYVGVANFGAWDAAAAYYLSKELKLPFACLSAEYSLLNRLAETEILPAVAAAGLGFIAWSGLARGVLTGKYRHGTPADSRAASATLAGFVEPYLNVGSTAIVEGVLTAAKGLDLAPSDVALGWALSRPEVSTVLVGPRTELQASQIFSGADTVLPEAILQALDDISG